MSLSSYCHSSQLLDAVWSVWRSERRTGTSGGCIYLCVCGVVEDEGKMYNENQLFWKLQKVASAPHLSPHADTVITHAFLMWDIVSIWFSKKGCSRNYICHSLFTRTKKWKQESKNENPQICSQCIFNVYIRRKQKSRFRLNIRGLGMKYRLAEMMLHRDKNNHTLRQSTISTIEV